MRKLLLIASIMMSASAMTAQAQQVFGPGDVTHLGEMWTHNKAGFLRNIQDTAQFTGGGVVVAITNGQPVVNVGTGAVTCAERATVRIGDRVIIHGYIGSAMSAWEDTPGNRALQAAFPPAKGVYDPTLHAGVGLVPGCTLTRS
jgi:hypothetical protein